MYDNGTNIPAGHKGTVSEVANRGTLGICDPWWRDPEQTQGRNEVHSLGVLY